MRRREFIGATVVAGVAGAWFGQTIAGQEAGPPPIPRKGRIKQGLWPINFGGGSPPALPPGPPPAELIQALEKEMVRMCEVAVRVGAHGFDILPPATWPIQRRHGLTPTLAGPGDMDFDAGIVHPATHDAQLKELEAQARICAEGKVRRFGINAGQRRGLSYAMAANHAVALLDRLKDTLEKLDVTVCLENINSRRSTASGLGRDDMVFGHWDWGMDVVARVNSPKVKLLCDIYHLQIEDGDVAWRIRESIGSIGHFHVAGVPTRRQIDDDQELDFRYIAEVIAALPYDGYVSHEWEPSPGRDPVQAIEKAVALMDV